MKLKRNYCYKIPEKWYENTLVIWQEDECLRKDPTAEHINDMYLRYTGKVYNSKDSIASHDFGDETHYLMRDGWIVIASFCGYAIAMVVTQYE